MRKSLFRASALLTALLIVAALAGCDVPNGNKLTVGVKGDVPNFGLYDEESGNYSGMEIELAELLCRDMGYDGAKLVTVAASDREELLASGAVDIIIATYSVTDERREQVNFTESYYRDMGTVVVERSSLISTMQELRGCTIGFLRDSSMKLSTAEYLAELGVLKDFDPAAFEAGDYRGAVDFVEYDSYEELSDALERGEVDAMAGDRSIVKGFVDEDRIVLPGDFAVQEYAAATSRTSGLFTQLNEAMNARLEDGTIDRLIVKWGN